MKTQHYVAAQRTRINLGVMFTVMNCLFHGRWQQGDLMRARMSIMVPDTNADHAQNPPPKKDRMKRRKSLLAENQTLIIFSRSLDVENSPNCHEMVVNYCIDSPFPCWNTWDVVCLSQFLKMCQFSNEQLHFSSLFYEYFIYLIYKLFQRHF